MRAPSRRARPARLRGVGPSAAWLARAALMMAAAAAMLAPGAAAQVPVDDDPVPWHRREEAARKAQALERAAEKAAGRRTAGASPRVATSSLTPNQLDWDVTRYELALDLDPVTSVLTGTVTMTAKVVAGPLSSVELDLARPMVVTAARAAGMAAGFSHPLDLLTVTLDRAYLANETFTVAVDYQGTPDPAYGSFGFDSGAAGPLIWSLSEPFGARAWWPCKDDPSDKAQTLRVALTVPATLTAVSNGTLTSTNIVGSKKTYTWDHLYPISSYLVSVAAHPYTSQSFVYNRLGGGTMPVTVWSYPSAAASAAAIGSLTVQMLGAYAGMFGEYPFATEKYGQAQFPWGGGMEHQTVTSLCCWSEFLTAHELAHQWFGDAVTCENFSEVWLNEGFATYAEALWDEFHNGPAAYWTNILANRFYGSGTIYVPPADLGDFNRIFDSNLSYSKASWVLHMLRGIVGDPTFFAILRAWITDPGVSYGTATTADFETVAAAVSGIDLTDFFADWIHQPYYPTYRPTWTAALGGPGWQVGLTVEQLQSHALYSMPLRVRVTTTGGPQDFVVANDQPVQSYTLGTTAQPLDVELDPDQWVLRTIERPLQGPTFHRGVLLVNGVSWSTYGSEITTAYADSVFAGHLPFSFWDLFAPPAGGYAAQLPAPLGNGALPDALLGQFSTVVWVGNEFAGDLTDWAQSAVLSYLQAGGNVLLLARLSQDFLSPPRAGYLGLRWAETPSNTIQGATAVHPAMVPMSRLGTQNTVAVFETAFDQPGTVLLLSETQSFATPRGLAAWRHPAGGGTLRPSGGHLAHIAGRPYRWVHNALRANTHAILTQLFGESGVPLDTPPLHMAATRLLPPAPNPFNPRVEVRFTLAQQGRAMLAVYDLRGRHVRTLFDEVRPAGDAAVLWDGRDDAGAPLASGVYALRLSAGGAVVQRTATLIR